MSNTEPGRKPVPVDLGPLNTRKAQEGTYRDPDVFAFGLPMDLPIWAKVYRLMKPTAKHKPPLVNSTALVGHTVELCDPTYGVTVYIRRGMGDDQTLKIMIKDGDGIETVATYTKE